MGAGWTIDQCCGPDLCDGCRERVYAAENAWEELTERVTKAQAELAEARRENEWLYHNMGLYNEWAREWIPKKHGQLIPWLKKRVRDALAGEQEEGG